MQDIGLSSSDDLHSMEVDWSLIWKEIIFQTIWHFRNAKNWACNSSPVAQRLRSNLCLSPFGQHQNNYIYRHICNWKSGQKETPSGQKETPSGQFVRKVGKSALELGKKKSVVKIMREKNICPKFCKCADLKSQAHYSAERDLPWQNEHYGAGIELPSAYFLMIIFI